MDKNVVLVLKDFVFILAGSTFGVFLRFFIKNNFKKKLGFNINYISIVNILSALFLGGFLALELSNKNLIMLFYIGFLGCLSTFSSFIYQLFQLIQRRDYISFFFLYIDILLISSFLFLAGYLTISILKF